MCVTGLKSSRATRSSRPPSSTACFIHVHILHIDGRSYRLREIGDLLQAQFAGSSSPQARKGAKQPDMNP